MTSRSPLVSSALLSVAMVFASPALSQTALAPESGVAISPILVLNQEAMFSQSAIGQRIVSELERDQSALALENRRIEAELIAEEQQLTEQRPSLSSVEFSKLAADFDEKVQRLRQGQDRKSRALQERLDVERRNFISRAGPILADIARERGALVVLDNSLVLMSFDIVDITEEAVARLDETIGDGSTSLGPSTPSPDLRPIPRFQPQGGTSSSGNSAE